MIKKDSFNHSTEGMKFFQQKWQEREMEKSKIEIKQQCFTIGILEFNRHLGWWESAMANGNTFLHRWACSWRRGLWHCIWPAFLQTSPAPLLCHPGARSWAGLLCHTHLSCSFCLGASQQLSKSFDGVSQKLNLFFSKIWVLGIFSQQWRTCHYRSSEFSLLAL